jgi:hypothetical protein
VVACAAQPLEFEALEVNTLRVAVGRVTRDALYKRNGRGVRIIAFRNE